MGISKREFLTKFARSENSMYTFVVLLIIFMLFVLWVFLNFPLWVNIPITIILLWSLYYQFAAVYYNVAGPMMHTKIEDRIMNEIYYQVTKRGYEMRFVYRNDKLRVKRHNVPKYKAKWIKFISFLHVVSRPAWAYRDVDESEALEDDDEDEVYLIPTPFAP